MTTSRRGLLIGVAGLAAIAWSWQRFGVEKVNLTFEPIPGLDGWRRASTGAISGSGSATNAVFLGLEENTVEPLARAQLCETLYASAESGVPIAVFTDINCPNCRSLEAKLEVRRSGLSLTYLQLPLLGEGSEAAARVAIAAEVLSGVPAEPPRGLRGTGLSALVRHHAERSGLTVETLNNALTSPEVETRLTTHRRAAETLGVFGTPSMTIGQTLVIGDIPTAVLDQLLTTIEPVCS